MRLIYRAKNAAVSILSVKGEIADGGARRVPFVSLYLKWLLYQGAWVPELLQILLRTALGVRCKASYVIHFNSNVPQSIHFFVLLLKECLS